jgi:hypothetical protein
MTSLLIAALIALFPGYLDTTKAQANVNAAISASIVTGVDAELLLGMAYVESRYNPLSLSRMQCEDGACRRVARIWTGSTPPHGARPTWYCGVLQTGGNVPWDKCLAMRDLTVGYLSGAEHLVEWMQTPRCAKLPGDDRLVCALRGYSGGWAAIAGQANSYVNSVLAARHRIEHQIASVSPRNS